MKRLMQMLTAGLSLLTVTGLHAQSLELVGTAAVPGVATAVCVVDTLAYVTSFATGLQVLTAADPSRLELVGAVNIPSHARDVLVAGGYAYVADSNALRTYDIADPRNPVLTATLLETAPPHSLWKLSRGDQYLTLMNGDTRLMIVNPADPAAPVQAGEFQLSGGSGAHTGWGAYEVVSNSGQLRLLDLGDPAQPVWMSGCAIGFWGFSVTVRDSIAYVHRFWELVTVDLRDPAAPRVLGRDSCEGESNDLVLIGDYAVFSGHDGMGGSPRIHLYNVADPAAPFHVAQIEPVLGMVHGLCAQDSVVYAACQQGLATYRLHPPGPAPAPPPAPYPASVFRLEPAAPNPFNARTVIAYHLPRAGLVELAVYDALGRQVTTLLQGTRPAGTHHVTWDATSAASGLYFARLEAGAAVRTQKLLLVR